MIKIWPLVTLQISLQCPKALRQIPQDLMTTLAILKHSQITTKKLFAVPPNFISQIRLQYATGASAKPKRKCISKLLGKKSKGGEEIPPPPEELRKLKEVKIEVHAPQITRESAVITFNESTTAKDVLYQ
ncbi:rho GTPase-activating protein 18 [Biomphalaria glabrata]|nr:rho GTPase-activating protein 18-like [Biomphalaria glabrata]